MLKCFYKLHQVSHRESAAEKVLCCLPTFARGFFHFLNAVVSANFGCTGRLHYFSAVHKVRAHASYMVVIQNLITMKTPTWAIVVGIFLMLFGGCSVTKSIQAINMPDMLEMQTKMMEKMTQSSSTDSITNNSVNEQAEVFQGMAEGMQEMFAMSEFTKTWTVRFGYLGIIVAIAYIFSGIFLMVRRDFSIKLAYGALVLSMIFSVIQSMVLASDSSGGFISKAAGFGNSFGIILDLILLVVIVAMDKSAFEFNGEKSV